MEVKNIVLPCLLIFSFAIPGAHADSKRKNIPNDFDKMWVQIISDPVETVDGSFAVDGLIEGDGIHFHKNILGMNDEEIEESRIDALTHFSERFGLEVDNPSVYFTGFESLPGTNYHVTLSSGDKVPSAGWRLDDGGWIMVVTDPNGVMLGGEFMGRHVPSGAFFVVGTYKINRTTKHKKEDESEHDSKHESKHKSKSKSKKRSPLLISYRSGRPIIPQADGSMHMACDLMSEEYGEGLAMGTAAPKQMPDGKIAFNIRMVVTFPPLGYTIEEELDN